MTSEATGLTTRAEAQDTFVALLTTPFVSAHVAPARFTAVLQHRAQLTEWTVRLAYRLVIADDLDLRPVFHRLTRRVKAHVLICMLAAYLVWHLRKAWAPLTYTDQDPPAQPSPVAPARRSQAAAAKAARQHDQDGHPYRSFRGLLEHLATLTRNQVRFAGAGTEVPVLAEPTTEQRQAFDLIGAAIPLTLT
jgi:hypothetical protein